MSPESIKLLAPVIVTGLFVLAVIIGILTRHQRNMAELMQRQAGPSDSLANEIHAMHAEIRDLARRMDAMGNQNQGSHLADRLGDKVETRP